MGRKRKPITVVVHPPESERAMRRFEKTMCDFYIKQVEQRLRPLPKEYKLEALDTLISSFDPHAETA